MWTASSTSHVAGYTKFQSLSRDSVHVDVDGQARERGRHARFNPSVGIPSMWTRRSGPELSFFVCFNPSVGIPSMWTGGDIGWERGATKFQSLSRDSVHVDPGGTTGRHVHLRVSIPQSGFRPCGRQEIDLVLQRRLVSIPQSGFRPCGPSMGDHPDRRVAEFQSLSRDSVHVDWRLSPQYGFS